MTSTRTSIHCLMGLTAPLVFVLGLAVVVAPPVSNGQDEQVLSPPYVVEAADSLDHWDADDWVDEVTYSVESSSRTSRGVLRIQSGSLTQGRYHRQVPLTPKSKYRLSFWIKTVGVQGNGDEAGADVRLGDFEFAPDNTVRGITDWTRQTVTFSTHDDDSMVLEFLLGKEAPARVTVLIDGIVLERTARTPLDPSITINLDERRTPMSEYIYGQFIEHMGQSIYGGIWAEMLEGRVGFVRVVQMGG